MKLLSLFSGIGAFEKALSNIKKSYDLVGYCEIDPQASSSYAAIHRVSDALNYQDVTKIDEAKLPKDIDLITYGFPCQDISVTGKQKGLFEKDGSLTRSGLFFDALRVIKETKPKVAIAENVKNLTSSKFANEFDLVLSSLEQAGYNNYYKVLKASDYGIPQARERVFVVSIRQDLDKKVFQFPAPCQLQHSLLELSDFREQDDLTEVFFNRYLEREDCLAEMEDFQEYLQNLSISQNEIHTKCMNLYSFNEMNTITLLTGISGTLTCRNVVNNCKKYYVNGRLYRPSPKMCFRLMGFSDEDYERARQAVLNDRYLYKQAGNSIVVGVAEKLLEAVFKAVDFNNVLTTQGEDIEEWML